MNERNSAMPNVFSPRFLELLSHVGRPGTEVSFEAAHAGPWSVVEVPEGHAVVRAGGGEVQAVFSRHETAHLYAAVLPGAGRPVRFRVRDADGPGVVIEAVQGKGYVKIGWLRDYDDETLEALHVAECLLRSPASLALFLQAASYESLEPAGSIAAGRWPAKQTAGS